MIPQRVERCAPDDPLQKKAAISIAAFFFRRAAGFPEPLALRQTFVPVRTFPGVRGRTGLQPCATMGHAR